MEKSPFLETNDLGGDRFYCVCGYSRELPIGWRRSADKVGGECGMTIKNCPRCNGRLFPDLDPDYPHCLNHGPVYVGPDRLPFVSNLAHPQESGERAAYSRQKPGSVRDRLIGVKGKGAEMAQSSFKRTMKT